MDNEETSKTGETGTSDTDVMERLEKVIEKISQRLAMDGGGVELVTLEGDTVKVRLRGACVGCPMSQMTLKMVVESSIKSEVPEIKKVEAV